jgi:hypothetical protein
MRNAFPASTHCVVDVIMYVQACTQLPVLRLCQWPWRIVLHVCFGYKHALVVSTHQAPICPFLCTKHMCMLQVVRWFWDVVHHHLQRDQQQQLLAFVTGSDRVPIKGLAALNPPLVISR